MQFQLFLALILPLTALAATPSEYENYGPKKYEEAKNRTAVHNTTTIASSTYCLHCNKTATKTELPASKTSAVTKSTSAAATNASIPTSGVSGSSFEAGREMIMVGGVVIGAVVMGLGL